MERHIGRGVERNVEREVKREVEKERGFGEFAFGVPRLRSVAVPRTGASRAPTLAVSQRWRGERQRKKVSKERNYPHRTFRTRRPSGGLTQSMGLSDSERLGLGIPIRGIGVYGRFNVNQSGEGHGLTDRRFDLVDDRREITKAQLRIEFHLGAH